MGERLRTLTLLAVLLGVGILLGSSVAQWWGSAPALPVGSGSGQIQGRLRVEVLNSGGTPGVAREATVLLRDRGLDVVYYGNAENFSQEPSVVLDRVGDLDGARAAAEVLGISEVRASPDSSLFVDVTVRLGPEWSPETATGRGAPGERSWWDPRGILQKKRDTRDSDSTGP